MRTAVNRLNTLLLSWLWITVGCGSEKPQVVWHNADSSVPSTAQPMVAGLTFHAGLYYFLPVTVFSIASMVAYLAYLHPDDVHRAFGRMLSRGPAEE